MRIFAVTDESGKVIATAQFSQTRKRGSPYGGRVTPLPGQTVHQLNVPPGLCKIKRPEDVARLHAELEKRLEKRRPPGGLIRRRRPARNVDEQAGLHPTN